MGNIIDNQCPFLENGQLDPAVQMRKTHSLFRGKLFAGTPPLPNVLRKDPLKTLNTYYSSFLECLIVRPHLIGLA